MRPTVKYVLTTLLFGLFVVPLLTSLLVATFGMLLATGLSGWGLGAAIALLALGPIYFARGRRAPRPAGWLELLLPVIIPPAYYLLAWVIAFGITGLAFGDTVNIAVATHAPYFAMLATVLFVGSPVLIPVVLLATLVVCVGAFVFGVGRTEPAPSGRNGLIGLLVGALVVAGVGAGQLVQVQLNAAALVGEPVSQEVELWQYRPFAAGNKLVAPPKPTLQLTDDFPVLDGATAAYPVYAAMGQAIYQLPDAMGEQERDDFVSNHLDCAGTSDGYDHLIGHQADVFFGAQPSKGQRAAAEAVGQQLNLTPIGREAFVIFVNQDNPVTGLTTAQVQDIYSRRISSWKQVGGEDRPIIAFQRPEDSGSQTIMLAKVMNGQPMATPLKEERVSGMGGIVSSVADYRNSAGAIGYSFRWYATVMNGNPGIRLLAIDGIEPSVENIRNGSYPLTVDLYAVTSGTSNPNAVKLVDWLVSAEGQALVEQVGYVGLKK